ncbi:MAG: Ig-like domain-containing protein [Amphritea sp.]
MNTAEGVVIHTGSAASRNSSYLLDMTPGSDVIFDWYDPTLIEGQTYSDADAGISITSSWMDSSSTETAPSISATPAQSGWGALLSNSSVSQAPGGSATVSLTVTSSTAATDGFYTITFQVTDGKYTGSENLTYIVNNPVGNSAPIALNDSIIVTSKSNVTIAVLSNDSDPDGDAFFISVVTQGAKGKVLINTDGSLTYQPVKSFKNSDSFTYTISDGSKSASASVSIQLQSSGGSDGSTGGKGNGKKR